MKNKNTLSAGDFSAWLKTARDALISAAETQVNCGDCNACCTSSYFIHIQPEETKTISRINKQLLFPAPGLPKGHVLMGYDQKGRCPMLINGACSIYQHRANTCRAYDCRVFTAAGIDPGGADKALIKKRTDQWEFNYPTQSDRDEHDAVRAAAKFIQGNASCFPDGAVPHNPSQLAILAIKVYDVFIQEKSPSSQLADKSDPQELARAIIMANESFEARRNGVK